MKPEQARQTVELMAKNANVVMNDAYFGPAQPAMTPAGPGSYRRAIPSATETPKPAAPATPATKPPASKPAAVKTQPAAPKTAPAK